MKKETLNPNALAMTFAVIVFIICVIAYLWHGLMGQPSMIGYMYPGFWMSPMMMLVGLVVSLIAAYILGYIFALVYNWAEKR